MLTLKAEWKRVCKLQTELINAAFEYGRNHNKDNFGTPAKRARSKKKLIKALEEMLEYLEGKKVVKMKPREKITAYRTDSKMVYLINKK